jgi:hypothetical protein
VLPSGAAIAGTVARTESVGRVPHGGGDRHASDADDHHWRGKGYEHESTDHGLCLRVPGDRRRGTRGQRPCWLWLPGVLPEPFPRPVLALTYQRSHAYSASQTTATPPERSNAIDAAAPDMAVVTVVGDELSAEPSGSVIEAALAR